jgi:hypothetical protein
VYHILKHKDAVHIFIISSIWFTLILSYNLCSISHKSSLPLAISCLKLLIKPDLQGLLSMPVNNITHAQHFPLLIVNTILQSSLSKLYNHHCSKGENFLLSLFSTATFCQINEHSVITGSSFQYWLTRLMLMSIALIPEWWKSIPSLIWVDSSLLPHRPRFNPRPVHVRFVVEKVTHRQVIFQVLQFLPVSIIPHYFILK